MALCLTQIRAALLEEIRLAAHVLLDAGCFTAGIAAGVSCHIYSHLAGDVEFDKPLFLDHARLLDEEPLTELLDFLWLQLGLRWSQLPQVLQANELAMVRALFQQGCSNWSAWLGESFDSCLA